MVATKHDRIRVRAKAEQEKEDLYYDQYAKVIDAIEVAGDQGATKVEIVRTTEIDHLIVETILRSATQDRTLIRIRDHYIVR